MIYRVFPDNEKDIKDLKDFYDNIYVKCFPNENERESFENILYYLNESDNHEDYTFYVFLYKDYDTREVQGGLIFDCFFDINIGFLEFLAVKPNCQSKGIGDKLYRTAYNILYSYEVRYIFGEIDKPEYNNQKVKKYLYMWKHRGYKRVEMKYIQPALSENKQPVDNLWLNVLDVFGDKDYIDKDVLFNSLEWYFRCSMNMTNSIENKYFKRMYNSLFGDKVYLIDIKG